MDTSLWQMFGKIYIIHPSHKWLPPTLSCGQHSSPLSTWSVPRLRLCWRLWGLEINHGRSLMYLRKPNICLPSVRRVRNKRQYPTVLQKTEIISLDAGLRMEELLALDLWDVVIAVLSSTNSTKTPIIPASEIQMWRRNLIRETPPNPTTRKTEMLITCWIWITSLQTHTHLKVSLSCAFSKLIRQWSRWS